MSANDSKNGKRSAKCRIRRFVKRKIKDRAKDRAKRGTPPIAPPILLAGISASLLLLFLPAPPALAFPQLGLQLDRTEAPLNRGDERLVYTATVKNEASANPKLGDLLTCSATSAASWIGNPTPTLAFEWLRNGVAIPGENATTYTVAAADEGKAIQCEVTGTNQSAPVGTADTQAGSNTIENVITATGDGALTSGSKEIKGLTVTSGRFATGQTLSGECIPPGTTIEVTESFFTPVLFLSAAVTCSGSKSFVAGPGGFGPGASIGGPGIPAGTTVTARSGRSLTLSNAATATAAGVAISGSFPPLAASLISAAAVVEPQPAIFPSGSAKPEVKADFANPNGPLGEGAKLTCIAPAWTAGEPIGWSFQWLRNGAPAPHAPLETTATSSKYELQAADVKPASNIQCEAIASAGGVSIAVLGSGGNPTEPVLPRPYQLPASNAPTVDFSNQTSGPVTLHVELPGGEETYAFKALGKGWTCTKEAPAPPIHAQVECRREDSLIPQGSFPPVQIVISVGIDPPEPLVTEAEVSGGGSAPASARDEYTIPNPALPFGFRAFETEVLDALGDDYTKAGGHPFSASGAFEFNAHMRVEEEPGRPEALNGSPRIVRTDIPPGFLGNPEAFAELCPSVTAIQHSECPAGSAAGTISTRNSAAGESVGEVRPVFAMEPEDGVAAQFAFKVTRFVFTLAPELRPEDGYAISLATPPLAKTPEIYAAKVKLCGFGAELGIASDDSQEFKRCLQPGEPGATEIPFLTNPTRCTGGPPTTVISADSWEEPGNFVSKAFAAPPLTECDRVPFEPAISLHPTSRRADSPTGMDVELSMPTAGLEDPFGTAQANLKSARVTLPVGMAVNPSAASGLGACTLDEIGISAAGVPDNEPVGCPESSKVGSVEAETPLLDETLKGDVYVARQGANPFGSLLALYMAIDSPKRGILVKLAGKVSPDPVTGQLSVSFEDNPEVPIKSVRLHFDGGERAALINPPACGNYGAEGLEGISASLSPWTAADPDNPTAAETVTSVSPFVIDEGPGGGPCPTDALEPRLSAGMRDAQAGSVSPFTLRLSREDGTQRFRAVDVTMPKGLVAYLKGIPYCSDATLASIPTAAGTGAAQLGAPSCPAASRVGTAIAGAGAGASPFFLDTARAYLAPPYKGAPLSLAIVAPAVAGPFDLGNVVVRTALRVNPETAEITAVSDPLPTILQGLLLDVRDIRVDVDRPNFTIAPTNCEPMAVTAKVTGDKGAQATVSDRFQVGGCDKLKFKPDLKLRLHGKTRRGAYQRLVASVTYPPGGGYANVASAAVTFPHSTFLAQEHIRTICTRVQFAADQCPKGSIYGHAKATSPLVDYALEGPVYLRSSSNPLPDVVVALRGPARQPLEIDLAGRVDSKKGGIRNTFDLVPDAPVTKFVLEMKGGKKSLLVNSRNLCKGTQRATVRFEGQNGMSRNFRPVVANDCKQGKGKKR